MYLNLSLPTKKLLHIYCGFIGTSLQFSILDFQGHTKMNILFISILYFMVHIV